MENPTTVITAPKGHPTVKLETLRPLLALLIAAVAALCGIAPAQASAVHDGTRTARTLQAAAQPWQDGTSDSDTIIDFITQQPSTGVSAQAGWRSSNGQVPRVGEVFWIRGYIGLVSLPYSGKVTVLPELLPPNGVEWADDVAPVRWALGKADQPQSFSTQELTYDRGRNGGALVGTPDGQSWTLRQGDVLEIQVPVRATRTLIGPGTQQPQCQDRREGKAPCPVSQSGDHLQIAFTVAGHGGDKTYVTPFVGMFAQAAAPARSTTAASYRRVSGGRWQAAVAVRAAGGGVAHGRVVVRDRGRQIATGTLDRAGRATVRLPRLKRGTHVLSVRYAGSSAVAASVSAGRIVRVR